MEKSIMTKGTQGAGQLGGSPGNGALGQGNVGSYPKYTGNVISEKINTSPPVPQNMARSASDAKVSTNGMPKGNSPSAPRTGH